MRQGFRLAGLALALLLGGCAGGSVTGPRAGGANLAAPAAAPAFAIDARRLLVRRCQNCHALPNPNKYERATWERKLVLMERKVRLPASEWDALRGLVPLDVDTAAAPPRGPLHLRDE